MQDVSNAHCTGPLKHGNNNSLTHLNDAGYGQLATMLKFLMLFANLYFECSENQLH